MKDLKSIYTIDEGVHALMSSYKVASFYHRRLVDVNAQKWQRLSSNESESVSKLTATRPQSRTCGRRFQDFRLR